jgi:DNA-directed RNA polymerase subunit RPC12/RpoP
VYPLDGGQILRSLLWFLMGRARSLMVATVLGFVGIAGLIYFAIRTESWWTGAISVFLAMNCWNGFQHARALLKLAKLPRREGFACPSCRTAPLAGAYWKCDECKEAFDTFATRGVCPHCGHEHARTICIDCQELNPMSQWLVGTHAAPGVVSASFEVK